jgi:hypothetical protein
VTPAVQEVRAAAGETKVTARFTIRNDGRDRLIIRDITTSCGCIVASASRRVAAPGESLTVTVEGEAPGIGRRTVQAYIRTNEPSSPRHTLALAITKIKPPPCVLLSPATVQFGEVFTGFASSPPPPCLSFSVDTQEPKAMAPWPIEARCDLPYVRVRETRVETLANEGENVLNRHVFSAEITALPKPGEISGEIRILDPSRSGPPESRFKVLGTVRPVIHAQPPSLYVNLAPGDEPARFHFEIRSEEPGLPLEASLEENARAVANPRVSRKDDATIEFEFQLPSEGSAPRKIEEALVVKTNHPRFPEILVPLRVGLLPR